MTCAAPGQSNGTEGGELLWHGRYFVSPLLINGKQSLPLVTRAYERPYQRSATVGGRKALGPGSCFLSAARHPLACPFGQPGWLI